MHGYFQKKKKKKKKKKKTTDAREKLEHHKHLNIRVFVLSFKQYRYVLYHASLPFLYRFVT